MTRAAWVSAALASAVALGQTAAWGEYLPTAVFVGVPDTDRGITSAADNKTCSTTAVPPQEVDVFDPTRVTARGELTCGESHYPATLTAQFLYFGDGPSPSASATPVGTPARTIGDSPLTAQQKLSRATIKPGWYKTIATSRVVYPFTFDRRRSAPQGCSYVADDEIMCTAVSSVVHVESLRWLQWLAAENPN